VPVAKAARQATSTAPSLARIAALVVLLLVFGSLLGLRSCRRDGPASPRQRDRSHSLFSHVMNVRVLQLAASRC